ncbi:Tetratricopeptide repeat-containing protein [Thermoflavifilum thermophilum]|uniref:Tetratricopeptide repeat-containing protein n=1 Tax=Thermoflavifilum thermophilum TaxID=1393122 RepID=A0A1I7MZQ4_9BACT|nr:Tetratricopeptide repeat-containing protein [Thermoflavifilum thermophilum]
MADKSRTSFTSSSQHAHHTPQSFFERLEIFYLQQARIINIVGVVIILLIGGYFGYKYLYLAPRNKRAASMIFKAQQYFGMDSLQKALNGDGNNYGFLQVIKRYGDTKVGHLAKYYAGVCYLRMGKYQEAIPYLKSFHPKDKVVQAEDYGLLGDAYMELGKTDEGIAYYKKAAYYNPNDLFTPFYLKRAALACEKAGRVQEAISLYQEIKTKYPLSAEGRDIDKYLARLGVVQD